MRQQQQQMVYLVGLDAAKWQSPQHHPATAACCTSGLSGCQPAVVLLERAHTCIEQNDLFMLTAAPAA